MDLAELAHAGIPPARKGCQPPSDPTALPYLEDVIVSAGWLDSPSVFEGVLGQERPPVDGGVDLKGRVALDLGEPIGESRVRRGER